MPNLTECKDCAHTVSKKAKTCPNCGVGNPGEKPSRWGTLILVLTIFAFSASYLIFDEPSNSTRSPSDRAQTTELTPPNFPVEPAETLEQVRGYISEGRFGTAIKIAERFDLAQNPELEQLHREATEMLVAKMRGPDVSVDPEQALEQVRGYIAEGRYGTAIKIAKRFDLAENPELDQLHRDATEMLAAKMREPTVRKAPVRVQETKEKKANAMSDESRKSIWMIRGKAAVKAQLKDPNSAKFRNVYFHRGSDGIPMTCGEVNSKNSFGGYGGYQKFVSAGKPGNTFLEEEVTDFNVVWRSLCL